MELLERRKQCLTGHIKYTAAVEFWRRCTAPSATVRQYFQTPLRRCRQKPHEFWTLAPATALLQIGFANEAYLWIASNQIRTCAQACNRPLQALYSHTSEIANSSFDFVYTINVLEHIADIDEACGELQRVMRPDGTLFVFVPAHEVLWTSLDNEVGHVRRNSLGLIARRLGECWFRDRRTEIFRFVGICSCVGRPDASEKLNLFHYESENVRLYDRYVFPISRQLDRVLSGVVGKNLVVVARKPVSNS